MNLHHPPTQSKSSFVPISSLAKGPLIDVAVGAFLLPALLAPPQGAARHSKVTIMLRKLDGSTTQCRMRRPACARLQTVSKVRMNIKLAQGR
jgi:hypothetical protein